MTQESKIMIFHEISKTGLVIESIEQLITEELLSNKTSPYNWFEAFATELTRSNKTYFMANAYDFTIVQEAVRIYILKIVF